MSVERFIQYVQKKYTVDNVVISVVKDGRSKPYYLTLLRDNRTLAVVHLQSNKLTGYTQGIPVENYYSTVRELDNGLFLLCCRSWKPVPPCKPKEFSGWFVSQK